MASNALDSVSSTSSISKKSNSLSLRSIFRPSKRRSKESLEPSVDSEGQASTDFKEQKELKEQQLNCNVCFNWRNASLFPALQTCEHRTCVDCLRQYLTIAVKECRVMVSCPECSEVFHPADVHMILNDDSLYGKYEEFSLRRALVSIPDIRWCPAPDCSYAVIAAGCASCPQIKCMRPGCNYEFCYHCRQVWHPNTTCDVARMQNQMEIRSLSSSERKMSHSNDDIKPCPKCCALIIKMDDGSCNHMTCAVCGSEFCWLCMKEISDLHYLSPSGCTFWGKKPWSRKKKIMWQMGTLIGAPVGIALAAGVVLPAMMIGIPIYVGRRIRDRFDYHENIHKRNLAITGGVAVSILVSPFLAALTVGIGVPIALGYVYGVVPVSLCRSGGCTGVTTSKNGHGVNLEFDERDEVYMGTVGVASVKSSPLRQNSRGSSLVDSASVLAQSTGVLTVKASVVKDHQPSIAGSQDSASLDSRSYIAQFKSGDHDVDSHTSLIPAPRSTSVSVASSLDNVHVSNSVSVVHVVSASPSANVAGGCGSLPEVACEGGSFLSGSLSLTGRQQKDDVLSTCSRFSAVSVSTSDHGAALNEVADESTGAGESSA